MKYFKESYKRFDSFLRWQLFTGFVSSLTWTLSVPIVYKLQGVNWTAAYISVYLLLMNMSGLVIPLFKGSHIKNVYLTVIVLNIFYAASLFIYFYDVNLFLWVEVLLSVVYSIACPLLGIGWDVYVVKEYSNEMFEDFRYWEGIKDSSGGIIGSGLVALVSSLTDMDGTVKVFMIAMVFMLIVQHVNWNKHYRNMK